MAGSRPPRPTGGTWPVRFGLAELVRDLDRPAGWLLLVDGTPQSYVDLDDPGHLEFDYVQLLADVLDAVCPPDVPISAVHLGGGACTLARWVAARRPGSRQVVVEADEPLAQLVRDQLGTAGFRLRVGDGRAALGHLDAALSDVVVCDVFVGAQVPGHLATVEHVREVARVLRPGGTYLVNLADSGGLAFARQQAATLLEVLPHVLVLADPGVLRGRRFGNLVLAARDGPFPAAELRRTAARALGRARVLDDGPAFAAGATPAYDAAPPIAPTPPPSLFARR